VIEQVSTPFLLGYGALILVYLLVVPYSILRLLLKIYRSSNTLPG
jgi:hypothetical protein